MSPTVNDLKHFPSFSPETKWLESSHVSPICAHLATIADGVEALLAGSASQPILLPWQDRRHSSEQGCCSEGMHLSNGSGRNQKACDASYDATLVRDRNAGGRSRLDGHQQAAGAQQLHNDDGLAALSPPAFGQRTEPDRLAASSPVPTLDRPQLWTAHSKSRFPRRLISKSFLLCPSNCRRWLWGTER